MAPVHEEFRRRGALSRLRRCPLPVRGRPRHHRVACGERVLSLGQPGRSGIEHGNTIGDLAVDRFLRPVR